MMYYRWNLILKEQFIFFVHNGHFHYQIIAPPNQQILFNLSLKVTENLVFFLYFQSQQRNLKIQMQNKYSSKVRSPHCSKSHDSQRVFDFFLNCYGAIMPIKPLIMIRCFNLDLMMRENGQSSIMLQSQMTTGNQEQRLINKLQFLSKV